MKTLRSISHGLQAGIISGFIFFAGWCFFFFWAESQIRLPGGLRDIEYWESAMASTDVAADLMPLSGYLHQRVAEIMTSPKRNLEAILVFSWMDRVFQDAEPLRKTADLKHGLAVYKKQVLLSSLPSMKLYLYIRHFLGLREDHASLGKDLISDSDLRIEGLQYLRKSEKLKDPRTITSHYEQKMTSPEFSGLQAQLMLRLAYVLYEQDPGESSRWINQLRKKKSSRAVRSAASYLRNKLNQRKDASNKKGVSPERVIEGFLKLGLFEQAVQWMGQDKNIHVSSARLDEIRSWLGVSSVSVNGLGKSFLDSYMTILAKAFKDPVAQCDELTKLATLDGAESFSALLRHQAWGLAYFDAKDYSRAFFMGQFLKLQNPLSPYSQIEEINLEIFKNSNKVFTGPKLKLAWQLEPYRFEMNRKKDEWEGFKNENKTSTETLVHEGQVYVINYDASGSAKSLEPVNSGERVSTIHAAAARIPAVAKMSWMEQYFYTAMIKYIPLAVKMFKQQILKSDQKRNRSIFERLYSEEEFQSLILDRMKPSIGPALKSLQAQISSQGIYLSAIFDLKVTVVSLSGLGRLDVSKEDGRLILKLDHVKVGNVYMPKWILSRVEKSFNAIAAENNSLIDILKMDYQDGGILIKCRKLVIVQPNQAE